MKKGKKTLTKAARLVENDSFALSKSTGNGILRRQIWRDNDGEGEVTRYSLAYINPRYFPNDNGRVLGYDNAHGYHHRHYMGKVEPIQFKSFTDTEERFQQEFEVIHHAIRQK